MQLTRFKEGKMVMFCRKWNAECQKKSNFLTVLDMLVKQCSGFEKTVFVLIVLMKRATPF